MFALTWRVSNALDRRKAVGGDGGGGATITAPFKRNEGRLQVK
jgi:hypothetical protein